MSIGTYLKTRLAETFFSDATLRFDSGPRAIAVGVRRNFKKNDAPFGCGRPFAIVARSLRCLSSTARNSSRSISPELS